MARKKPFKTWAELGNRLDDFIWEIDSILVHRRTPSRTMPPELRRCLRKVIRALIEASGVVGEQPLLEKEKQHRMAAARIRAQGLPELPAFVAAEMRRYEQLRKNRA